MTDALLEARRALGHAARRERVAFRLYCDAADDARNGGDRRGERAALGRLLEARRVRREAEETEQLAFRRAWPARA